MKNFFVLKKRNKKTYNVINSESPNYCPCSSSNVIYLLTCKKCGIQYVGETVQIVRARMSKHKQDIIKGFGSCPFVIKHFNSQSCKGADFSISILEKLKGNGRTPRGAIDATQTSERRSKEKEWMKKLRTLFPYGLNHDTDKNLEHGDFVTAHCFPKLKETVKNNEHRHGRHNRGLAPVFSEQHF